MEPSHKVSVRRATTERDRLACLSLRKEVFIVEQKVPAALEIDEHEDVCEHFLATTDEGDDPVGTARMMVVDGKAKAQRVCVKKSWRGQHVGVKLMTALEARARDLGHHDVVLGAQISAVTFYEGIGYESYGPLFDDAGIPHRMMKKSLPRR